MYNSNPLKRESIKIKFSLFFFNFFSRLILTPKKIMDRSIPFRREFKKIFYFTLLKHINHYQ